MKRSAPTTTQASGAGAEHAFMQLRKVRKLEDQRRASGQFKRDAKPERTTSGGEKSGPVPNWSFKAVKPDEVKRSPVDKASPTGVDPNSPFVKLRSPPPAKPDAKAADVVGVDADVPECTTPPPPEDASQPSTAGDAAAAKRGPTKESQQVSGDKVRLAEDRIPFPVLPEGWQFSVGRTPRHGVYYFFFLDKRKNAHWNHPSTRTRYEFAPSTEELDLLKSAKESRSRGPTLEEDGLQVIDAPAGQGDAPAPQRAKPKPSDAPERVKQRSSKVLVSYSHSSVPLPPSAPSSVHAPLIPTLLFLALTRSPWMPRGLATSCSR